MRYGGLGPLVGNQQVIEKVVFLEFSIFLDKSGILWERGGLERIRQGLSPPRPPLVRLCPLES